MGEIIMNFLRDLIQNDILTVLLMAFLPIIELRGAIPLAVAMGMSPVAAFGFSFLGSSLIVPILLLLLKPVLNWMKKIKIFKSLAETLEGLFVSKADKVNKKASIKNTEKKILRRKMLGVMAFVAVPFPLTGVWTGSAIAVFLGIPFWRALVSVLAGNLTAGLIILALCLIFKSHVNIILSVIIYIFAALIAVYLVYFIIKLLIKKKKSKKADDVGSGSPEGGGNLE